MCCTNEKESVLIDHNVEHYTRSLWLVKVVVSLEFTTDQTKVKGVVVEILVVRLLFDGHF